MATGGTGNGWKKCPFFLGNVQVVQGESRPAAAKRLLYLWAEDAWIFEFWKLESSYLEEVYDILVYIDC